MMSSPGAEQIGLPAVMSSSHLLALIASSDSDAGGGGALIQLLILLLIPFAMYFFLIRPQRRRMREQQQLQRSIEVGDEVITTSGFYGTITGEDGENRFWLEIDDDVQIRIARAAIASKASPDDGDAGETDSGDDQSLVSDDD